MAILLAIMVLAQDESVESLLRRVGSDALWEREKAVAELKRRGEAAVDTLTRAMKQAKEPAIKDRFRSALEEILGFRVLTLERVRKVKVTCRLEPSTLRSMAARLERLSGLPIEFEGPEDQDPPIGPLEGTECPIDTLLDSLAHQAGGYWLVEGHRLLVVLPGKTPLRFFDARDLTEAVGDDPRLPLEPDGSDITPATEGLQSPVSGEELMALLKMDLDPRGQGAADGASLQFRQGWLIVRQCPEALLEVQASLESYRRRLLSQVQIEIEAYAVKPEIRVEESSLERLRQEAAVGQTARTVAVFDRTTRSGRRTALACWERRVFLTGYEAEGNPVTTPWTFGPRVNVRAMIEEGKESVRIDLEAGLSRLLSVERRRTVHGDVQEPLYANHTLRSTRSVPAGRFALLGRIGGTNLVEGMPDLVLMGRFRPAEGEGR